jgi:RND family efflux transporter MFP subunit
MKWQCVTCALLACGTLSACKQADNAAPAKEKPAEVAHHVDEQSLNTITLTQKAHDRLGIQLAEAKLASVQAKRTVGGEVVIPPGMSIVIAAPLAGTLLPPEAGAVPAPGDDLAEGDPVFLFQPLLTPERDVLTPSERVTVAQTRAMIATAQLEAQRQMAAARIEVETAQLAANRAQSLLQAKAGSQRTFDEAAARLRLAQEAEKTAAARHEFLATIELDEKAGQLSARTITAPAAGVLQSLSAAAGQTVSAGDPLFSIVNMDRVWVRVPIYIGHWRQIDVAAGASIAEYGAPGASPPRTAKYVAAPPSANAAATTVDIFYELDNADHRLYPGQKVAATLPLQQAEQRLVVPAAAIVLDVHGGAWVYAEESRLCYARRRVSVLHVDGKTATLERGLEPGRKVVTDGAAELFGTEFGVGH